MIKEQQEEEKEGGVAGMQLWIVALTKQETKMDMVEAPFSTHRESHLSLPRAIHDAGYSIDWLALLSSLSR